MSEKRLHFCMTNLVRKTCSKFYQNRSGFVTETIITFWCIFSVHSVVILTFFLTLVKSRQVHSYGGPKKQLRM